MKSHITFDSKTGNLTIPDEVLHEMNSCVLCNKPAVWKKNERGWMVQACEKHFDEVSKKEIELIGKVMEEMEEMEEMEKAERIMEKVKKNL